VAKKFSSIPVESTGKIKLLKNKLGTLYGCGRDEQETPAGGINLSSVPLTPAASEVFTPDELEERLQVYRQRLLSCLPFFSNMPRSSERPACTGC
jgi:hypothetical protein